MGITIKEIKASDTWALRQRVMWPDKPIDYVKLENDEDGIHFGLFKNDQLLSVISLFITDQNAQFRKFATESAAQGQGYGTKLLEHLMTTAKHRNITKIWCNARADKASFYKKSGMLETEQKFSKGGIDYITMQKTITI